MRTYTLLISIVLIPFFSLGQIAKQLVVKVDPTAQVNIPLDVETLSKFDRYGKAKKVKPENGESALQKSVLDGIYRIVIPAELDLQKVCDSLLAYGNVLYAEPIHSEELLTIPNDPDAQLEGNQPYLDVIKAYDAWDITTSNSSIVIGISDAGTDLGHVDLVGKYHPNDDPFNGEDDDGNGYVDDTFGYDFADDDGTPQSDIDPHGTQVAGVAGANTNNGVGIAGVGYNASLSSLKIFRSSDNLSANSYESILYAANNGFDIINLSWGSIDTYSQYNQDIIEYAVKEKDVVVVAAAGNTGTEVFYYPASYNFVLSVGSTNLDDSKSSFSTFNKSVDLVAPGTAIYSTQDGDIYFSESGTSFSAPMVAGVAALVKDQYPSLNAEQIMERIRVTSDDISQVGSNNTFKGKLGYGRLNALRAIQESGITSIRSSEPIVNGPFEGVFFGDTVAISTILTNYLDPVIQPNLSIEILSNNATFLNGSQSLDFMNTLTTQSVSDLRILVDNTAAPEEKVEYVMHFSAGGYEDMQLFDFDLNPNYFNHSNEKLSITLSGDGNLGYVGDGYNQGIGLTWNNEQLIKELSFMVAVDDMILDNAPINFDEGNRSKDFNGVDPTKPYFYQGGNYAYHVFEDTANLLRIEQTSLLPAGETNALVQEYRLTNVHTDTLIGLRVGLFENLELQGVNNKATIQAQTVFGLSDNETLFSGARLFQADSSFLSLLDISAIESELSAYTDSAKSEWMKPSSIDSLGFSQGTDIAILSGAFIDKIAPNESISISFLLGTASTKEELLSVLDATESAMNVIKENPLTEEILLSCAGASVQIDPSSGDQFYFFSDPFGTDTLGLSNILEVGPISSDTSIYVSNADNSYSGPIRSISINLETDIADFDIPEVLYITNSENSLNIIDQSFLPTQWEWDFGNGFTATGIQNPSTEYTSPGTYDITLSVNTEPGCTDSKTKTLEVVLNEVSAPVFDNINACEGQTLIISNTEEDLLNHYFSPMANTPISQGNSIEIDEITSDTTLYFSRVVDGVESSITSIEVDFLIPEKDFTAAPMTDSLTGQMITLKPLEDNISTIEWIVDGASIGEIEESSFPITNDIHVVTMKLTTSAGCQVESTKTVEARTSALPTVSDLSVCFDDSAVIQPTGGSIFGFYADSTLTQSIGTAKELTISELRKDTAIYVVGLTDFLPSEPVRVRVSVIDFDFQINTNTTELYLNSTNRVELSVDSVQAQFTWFTDGDISGIGAEQVYFFNELDTIDIWAIGQNNFGCIYTDSVQITVVEQLALGLPEELIYLYPNPAEKRLNIQTNKEPEEVWVTDVSGKLVHRLNGNKVLDISEWASGVYQLTIRFQDGQIVSRRLLVKREKD